MTEPPSPAHASLRLPRLVGREREQALLREHLAAAPAGGGALVLIGGDAGIGKTALAEDLCRAAAAEGALVLVGRCYDLSETPPYGPWAEAFARASRAADLPPPPDLAGGGATSQAALFAAVRDYLAALAARQPVLLLDDLHWADPASLELLRVMARQLAHLPLLLLAAYRADELTRRHPLYQLLPALVREARAERLDLRPLDDADVRALVAARYSLAAPELARLVAYLQGHAEGNPFYLGELLRTLEEERLLRPAEGGWALGDLTLAGVPPLLRQVIDGRVGRLGEGARPLLAVAATIGQEAPLDLWAAVAGVAEDALLELVERAVEARLLAVEPDGAGVRFAHALIREALYAGVLPPRRRGWHRRVAEALAAEAPPDPDAVAYHFRQAGDPRAVEWLLRAGARARRAGALVSAAERFAAAAGLLAGDDARASERGWLTFLVGLSSHFSDLTRSVQAMDEAEALALAAGDGALAAHARFQRGRFRCMRGERRRGLAEMEGELAALDALPRDHRLRSSEDVALVALGALFSDRQAPVPPAELPLSFPLAFLAHHLALAGRYRAALALSERLAAARADPGGTPHRGMTPGHLGRGHAHAALGRPAEARREYALAVADRRAAGDWFMVEHGHWYELHLVALPYQADDLGARARLAADGARAWAQALGTGTTATHGAQSALPLALLEGRWEEVGELAGAGRASAVVPIFQGALVALGTLARHRGAPDRAWELVRALHPAGPATAPGDGYFPHDLAGLALAADLALDAGDPALAGAWIAAHGRWLDWSGAILWRAEHEVLRARHAQLAGDPARARGHGEAALTHADEPRQPLALLAAHRLLGELATADRCYDDAARHLDAALALAGACAAPYERALTLLALAELHAATGDREAARSALDEVRAICEPLEARPALARAEALAARLAAPAAPPAYPAGLTAREVEVLRLVAAGLPDAQVAARLCLSPYTVKAHLRAIYGKLGVDNRTAAARFAVEHGLA